VVPNTDDKIYVSGMEFNSAPVVKEIARVEDYLSARAPVMPLDLKSEIYVRDKIPIEKDGFPISFKNIEGAFNIRTRGYPGNMNMARKGDIKIYKNVKFRYEEEGQVVVSESEAFKYYPRDPGRPSILLRGKYRIDKDLVVAVVSRPRQIRRYVDEFDIVRPIYYLYSRKAGDLFESYYSKINVGVPNVVTGLDYVVKDYG